jgi:hypothetical protein
LIKSGRNGGAWDGAGVTTSQSLAVNSNYTSLAVARASDVRPATATATDLWAGQTITGTDTLVMYTYGGDASLDGQINIDDYTTVIDANIVNQDGTFFTAGGFPVTTVPEPAAGALLISPAALLSRRRSPRAPLAPRRSAQSPRLSRGLSTCNRGTRCAAIEQNRVRSAVTHHS